MMTRSGGSNAARNVVAEVGSDLPSAHGVVAKTEATVAMAALPGTREQQASGMPPKAVMYLLLWYFWSGCTLFLNKYVVFYMKGDSTFLGERIW